MPIVTGDLDFYLTGAVSDGAAQADPDVSWGGFRSNEEITSGNLNNLFDNVSGDEAATVSGYTDYRCLCIKNAHGSLALTDAIIYLSDDDIGGTNAVSFAVEVPTTSDTTGSCQTIADEDTAPSVNGGNVSDWSTATTKATGVALNINAHTTDLGAGEIVFVWIRRAIAEGASAADNVTFAIKIEGDTAA